MAKQITIELFGFFPYRFLPRIRDSVELCEMFMSKHDFTFKLNDNTKYAVDFVANQDINKQMNIVN